MRCMNIDRAWSFGHGLYNGIEKMLGKDDSRIVNLPHDYMIESDVTGTAPAGPARGMNVVPGMTKAPQPTMRPNA